MNGRTYVRVWECVMRAVRNTSIDSNDSPWAREFRRGTMSVSDVPGAIESRDCALRLLLLSIVVLWLLFDGN
jgi:hypothetical protein